MEEAKWGYTDRDTHKHNFQELVQPEKKESFFLSIMRQKAKRNTLFFCRLTFGYCHKVVVFFFSIRNSSKKRAEIAKRMRERERERKQLYILLTFIQLHANYIVSKVTLFCSLCCSRYWKNKNGFHLRVFIPRQRRRQQQQ